MSFQESFSKIISSVLRASLSAAEFPNQSDFFHSFDFKFVDAIDNFFLLLLIGSYVSIEIYVNTHFYEIQI